MGLIVALLEEATAQGRRRRLIHSAHLWFWFCEIPASYGGRAHQAAREAK